MKRHKRGRATGRFEPGETFAAIPVEILRSDAYAALPDYAARVLFAVAGQFRGQNNGNLSMPIQTAREHGIRSAWKVQAGLRLLLAVGLIEMTRPGKYSHGRGICALYALTWKTIGVTPHAFPPIDNERPAPNTWAKWQRPDNWAQLLAEVQRTARGTNQSNWPNAAHDHSQRREQASSQRREQGKAELTPTNSQRREQERTRSSSQRGGSLLDSGRGGRSNARAQPHDSPLSSPSARNGIDAKILKLVHAQPHLTNADIARILAQYQIDANCVARVRAGGAP